MSDYATLEQSQASATSAYHSSDRSKRWLSYSQISTFLQCQWKWQARYVIRMQSQEPRRPMELGDAVHRMIASVFLGESPEKGLAEWKDQALGGIPEEFLFDSEGNNLVSGIECDARLIFDRMVADIKRRGWHVAIIPGGSRAVELELSTSLPTDLSYRFDGYAAHIDAIIYDPHEKVNFIVDWKTRKILYTDDSEEVNLQNAGYQKVAMDNGIPIAGTITYQIKSTPAKIPKLNKNGTMSRSQISSDWPTYKKALIDNGLDPNDYSEMQGKLDSDFVRPIKVYRSPEEIERIWSGIIIPVARQIAADTVPLRNMSNFTCKSCEVRQMCLAALRDHDYIEHLRSSFWDQEAMSTVISKGYL